MDALAALPHACETMTTFAARTISVTIERPWRDVYGFAADPAQMHRWATGLGTGLVADGDGYRVDTPDGPAHVGFAPRNDLGVLDHVVTLAAGQEVSVPLRVIANGSGCEVSMVVFRRPDADDDAFAADADWVRRDLQALKSLLEADRAPA